MEFSPSELLALGAIGGRAPRRQRAQQAAILAEFGETEPLPSVELVKRKRWKRKLAASAARAAARRAHVGAA